MEWKPSITIPAVVAVLGVLGAQLLAILSRRHERQQAARSTLFEPAQEFARAAIVALAALRYVTPPELLDAHEPVHRNAILLGDVAERVKRLQSASEAVDAVRATRAGVRLAFHPKSWAAEYSRQVLLALRFCLESSERFYSSHDDRADSETWIATSAPALRKVYKKHRDDVYEALDQFFEDVAERLRNPTWNPNRIAEADRSPESRESLY